MRLAFEPQTSFFNSIPLSRPNLPESSDTHAYMSYAALAVFRTRICEQHRQGQCKEADRCPHSHCQTWQRRNPNDFEYSPRLCPDIEFVRKGKKMILLRRCGRGRGCSFAHSKEEELYHPSMYKTKLCKARVCTRYFCPFAHLHKELRRPATEMLSSLVDNKNSALVPCRIENSRFEDDKTHSAGIPTAVLKPTSLFLKDHFSSSRRNSGEKQYEEKHLGDDDQVNNSRRQRTLDLVRVNAAQSRTQEPGLGSPTSSSTTASSIQSPSRCVTSSQAQLSTERQCTSNTPHLSLSWVESALPEQKSLDDTLPKVKHLSDAPQLQNIDELSLVQSSGLAATSCREECGTNVCTQQSVSWPYRASFPPNRGLSLWSLEESKFRDDTVVRSKPISFSAPCFPLNTVSQLSRSVISLSDGLEDVGDNTAMKTESLSLRQLFSWSCTSSSKEDHVEMMNVGTRENLQTVDAEQHFSNKVLEGNNALPVTTSSQDLIDTLSVEVHGNQFLPIHQVTGPPKTFNDVWTSTHSGEKDTQKKTYCATSNESNTQSRATLQSQNEPQYQVLRTLSNEEGEEEERLLLKNSLLTSDGCTTAPQSRVSGMLLSWSRWSQMGDQLPADSSSVLYDDFVHPSAYKQTLLWNQRDSFDHDVHHTCTLSPSSQNPESALKMRKVPTSPTKFQRTSFMQPFHSTEYADKSSNGFSCGPQTSNESFSLSKAVYHVTSFLLDDPLQQSGSTTGGTLKAAAPYPCNDKQRNFPDKTEQFFFKPPIGTPLCE